MSDYIQLSKEQKQELRKLGIFANNRIRRSFKVYEKAGKDIVPKEIVGKEMQIKEDWFTEKTPISTSIKFKTYKDYRKHLNYLRSFKVDKVGIKEFTEIQQNKVLHAIDTSLGVEVPEALRKKISKMSAPELTDFWKKYERFGSKMGLQYASDSAMIATLEDWFKEDIENLENWFGEDKVYNAPIIG